MDEHRPVDFSALDPMQEPEHWQTVVDTTLQRVDNVFAASPENALMLIASWRRRLVLAAAIAIALLVPVEFVLEKRESAVEQIQILVRLSTRSALGEGPPSGAELSRALGSDAMP